MLDIAPHFGRVVVAREDLLLVCQGRVESAVLLSILEYWTRVKLGMLNQLEHENEAREKEGLEPIDGDDLWIWKSHDELVSDSLGLLSRYSLRRAVKHLTELGLLETRNNPRYRWDRTTQYRLNVGALREALRKAHEALGAHERAISHLRECENEQSIERNQRKEYISFGYSGFGFRHSGLYEGKGRSKKEAPTGAGGVGCEMGGSGCRQPILFYPEAGAGCGISGIR